MTLFPVRQHLIVNRLIRLEDQGGSPGDTARVRADFLNPMRLAGEESGAAVTSPTSSPPAATPSRWPAPGTAGA